MYSPPQESLSARQAEIAAMVARGKSSREIAEALFLSPRTVENHITAIFNKLGVRSRVELTATLLNPNAGASGHPIATHVANTNLPLQRTSLIGREAEIADIVGILQHSRLVTVTGAGGVGKTRTALAVGDALLEGTTAGVWFVDLATLTQGSYMAAAVAQALNVQESPHRPLLETLLAYLKQRSLLLILDNCEHVIAEAAALADALLRDCPHLRILATSRERLRIAGERAYRLPSLLVPRPVDASRLSAAGAAEYSAVVLFAQRAQAIDHRFALTDDNAPVVAEICRRLDGIPLAIELAAARLSSLPLKTLSEKLELRFAILTGGDRTALPRHRTMRMLIDWSYDLLSPPERQLFERLSIFVGGCTLAAATAVFRETSYSDATAVERAPAANSGGADDTLSLLSSLVDKSLVFVDFKTTEPRYRLLESFGLYAREKLATRCFLEAVAHRHALVYLERADQLERAYETEPDLVWREQTEAELPNWRAALKWALGTCGDVVVGQRLVGALIHVWYEFATVEGRRWLTSALELVDERTPASLLAKLEITEAYIASSLCEHEAALATAERAITRCQDLGDLNGIAWAQHLAGLSLTLLGRLADAESLLRQALASARALGSRPNLVAAILCRVAYALACAGDFAGSRAGYSEALGIYKALGATSGAAKTVINLAELEFRAGDAEAALGYVSDALAILRERNAGNACSVATMFINRSAYLIALARYDEAEVAAREALAVAREQQRDAVVTFALQHLGAIAGLSTQVKVEFAVEMRMRAARILGFVDARLTVMGHVPREYTERQEYDQVLTVLRDAMGAGELARLMATGAAMTQVEAVEFALSINEHSQT